MRDLFEQQLAIKKKYPFPFVKIGNQYWKLRNDDWQSTLIDTAVPNVTPANNIEMITNQADREFSIDSGFWGKGTGISIADGVCHFINTNNALSKYFLDEQKYYKFTVTISNYVSGIIKFYGISGLTYLSVNGNGTFTDYGKSNSKYIWIQGVGNATMDLDNISIQEVGWLGSQALFDWIYANTVGTIAQKTYAACKAAAMQCVYNNDVANLAIYGRLYNWFAVYLWEMDRLTYNANLYATYGNTPEYYARRYDFRIPLQSEWQALSTFLGGDAVSGGKLKETGTAHWNSPNTGADNSSGFSALGEGYRLTDGTFSEIKSGTGKWTLEKYGVGITATYASITIGLNNERFGFALRLIRA